MVDYNSLINWAFYGMVTIIGSGVLSTIRKMNVSITELNITLAKLVERTINHEKEIDRHDERLRALERRKKP